MNPAFTAAVAREEHNRLLAYLHIAPLLCRCAAVTLTWRHLLELTLVENAFLVGGPIKRADVFQFLWRLNPAFRRPDGELPNLDPRACARQACRPTRWDSFRHRLRCVTVTHRLPVELASNAILIRIKDAFQDAPAESSDAASAAAASPLRPRLYWSEYMAQWFVSRGHAPDSVLDYGVAWSFQHHRAVAIAEGRAEAYIPPSAALIGSVTPKEAAP